MAVATPRICHMTTHDTCRIEFIELANSPPAAACKRLRSRGGFSRVAPKFNFASKALELGDQCHRRYIAFGIRKYLTALKLEDRDYSLVHKNLPNGCECYSLVKASGNASLEKSFACEQPGKAKNGRPCPIKACENDPRNTIPGVW